MTTISLKIASWAGFEADWAALMAALGEDVWLTAPDGARYLPQAGTLFSRNLRFDFNHIPNLVTRAPTLDAEGNLIESAVTSGPHVNILVAVKPGGHPAAGTALHAALIQYIAAWPWRPIMAAEGLDETDAYVHTLPNGSQVIVREIRDAAGAVIGWDPRPRLPKRIFA